MNININSELQDFASKKNNGLNSRLLNSTLSFLQENNVSTFEFISFLESLSPILKNEGSNLDELIQSLKTRDAKKLRAFNIFIEAFSPEEGDQK